jgi:putative DNA primase/helicase
MNVPEKAKNLNWDGGKTPKEPVPGVAAKQPVSGVATGSVGRFTKYAEAGFLEQVMPIIPPKAELHKSSKLDANHLGKIPGIRKPDGTWVGRHDWTKETITHRSIRTWDKWEDASIGIRTGKVVGVDIDVTDAALSEAIGEATLDILGPAPFRYGNPPKRLAPYRTATPRSKIKVEFSHPETGEIHAVEILGTGQQFVADGIHPKTGKPYRWEGGDLTGVGFDGLTKITPDQVNEFLDAVRKIMAKAGFKTVSKSKSVAGTGSRMPIGEASLMADARSVEEALDAIGNDFDYDEWIKFIAAIKAALGGAEEHYHVYENWSLRWPENTADIVRAKWDSIHDAGVGAAFIFKRAREKAGFVPDGAIDSAGRRSIKLGASLDDTVRAVDNVFVELDPPEIFQRGNSLVEVVCSDTATADARYHIQAGTGMFHVLGPNELRLSISKRINFLKFNATQKKWLPAKAPADVAQVMSTAISHWSVPRVVALSETPILSSDGNIIQDRGFAPASGLIYTGGAPEICVPETPTLDDAVKSAAAIMGYFEEFPFADMSDGRESPESYHASVVLAYVLTLVMRVLIPLAPLFLFRAHTAGTGKGLIIEAANTIVFGRNATLMPPLSGSGADEEERKRITSMLMRGITSAHLDNCTGDLGSGPLDALLTAPEWTDRILSRNDVPSLPQRMTLAASGNNIGVRGDTVRRVLLCSMDANVESPELRTFKRQNLITDIQRDRSQLLGHVFTILKAHLLAGRPNSECVKLGSFEQWAETVAAAVVWCGYQNPIKTQDEAREDDPVRGSVTAILRVLFEEFGSERFMAKDVEKCLSNVGNKGFADLKAAWGAAIDLKSPRRFSKPIGDWLRAHKGQVVEGIKVIEADKDRTGVKIWRIIKIS